MLRCCIGYWYYGMTRLLLKATRRSYLRILDWNRGPCVASVVCAATADLDGVGLLSLRAAARPSEPCNPAATVAKERRKGERASCTLTEAQKGQKST